MDDFLIKEVIAEMEEFYDAEIVPEGETFQEWIVKLKRAVAND